MTRKVKRGRAPLPTRCIRIDKSTSVPNRLNYRLEETGGRLGEYVSLSHRWSNPETPRSSTCLRNSHDRVAGLQSAFQDIDPLFTDVLLVASQVGIQYVWIDSLCIIQDSPQDWNAEAVKMADYYQNASFTIMAAVPPNKRSQGLFHLPEGDLYRLARLPYRVKEGNRKGHFDLSCRLDPARETQQHNQIQKNDLLSRGSQASLGPLQASAPPFRSPLDWQALISQYSTMQLTKPEEDRLVALSGVAQEFTTQESSTKLVCGLRPWCLGVDLLWKQDTAGIHSRYMEFPSWSWASVNTSVSWTRTDDATDCFSVLSVSSTPGGRAGSPAGTGGNTTSSTSAPSGTAIQAIATLSFAPEASMNTLSIRCRLLTVLFGPVLEEKSRDFILRASRYPTEELSLNSQPRGVALATENETVAGWGSVEDPDLQLDDAFARNPIIFALCISLLTVPRGSGLFSRIWGGESIFNVLLKKKLRSSDSANECSPQPTSVPAAASTSQITTPSGHQASGSSLTVPIMGSSPISSPSNAAPEPQIASSPPGEPENNTPSIPERLWSKAYNILEEKEPDVVKGYQEILERLQNEWANTAAPEELQNLQHCKSVKSQQMWRLVYSGLERTKRQAKVKESVSNIMETIDNLKGVVEKAVKYSSEAAIAWAGVSLGLEILSNPMKEPGLNRKGIAYVLSRMEWYWNLAELVLLDNSSVSSAALRTNLETQIIEFYKKLLLFQMRSACLYYRNWAGVILRDAVKLDDWSGELNSIKDAENLIRNDIEQYDNQDIRLKLGTIETSALGQAESLESICMILKEEARLKEKNKQDDKDKDCLAAFINSSELLRDILITMLQDPSLRDAILLVDALDECNVNRSKLTKLIVDLSKSCNTKWIVSSRDWPEIRQELAEATGLVSLDLEQEHESVSQAVKSYIRKKVDDLAEMKWKNDLGLKEKVFDYMQSHADDTFLWVALVCERLANSGIRKRLVMEELMKFPTSLTALYQAMMDRITDSSEGDRLKQILALVCVVYRPLTSDEIPTLVDSMNDYDEDDVEDTIASCGSFLTLQEREIFFVHQSAKEFLLNQGREVLFPRGINHKHAHVFSRSLDAMENTLRQDIYELGSPGILNPVEIPSLDPLACIEYSCDKGQMPELAAFVRDARRFIAHHKPIIETAPLQVYCSALIFCPESNSIRQRFSHQIPMWVTVKPEIEDDWDAHMQTIYHDVYTDHARYSPDGRYLACSSTGISQIYEAASGNLLCELLDASCLSTTVYSPDGLLLCCGVNHGMAILDATTFELIERIDVEADRCFFLPNSNNIAVVFAEHVTVLDWKTRERFSCFSLNKESSDVALLSASRIVEVSVDASEVNIWDLATGDCRHTFDFIGGDFGLVVCSLDGHWIAAASGFVVRLWYLDVRLGWVYKHDLSFEYAVECLTFSADSRTLISGSDDNFIRMWDETGVCIKVLKAHTQQINFLTVCQMRNQLASGSDDGTIKLWDLSHILSGQFRQERPPSVQTCDGSSEASELTSSSDEDLWIDRLLFSPTGKMLASISYEETHIWDTVKDICTDIIIYGGASGPDGVSFTPDDRLVAMGDANGKLGVWNTGLMAQIYFSDLEKPECVSISSDGRYVSSILRLNTSRPILLKIWDLIEDAQGQQHITSEILPLERIERHTRFVHSQDWKLLAIFNSFEGMRVFQRQSGHWVNIISPDATNFLTETPLVFTPDSEWLITYEEDPGYFLIKDPTLPSVERDLGSLENHALPYDTPKPEELCWRITTPFGILGVGKPSDFKGTRRIGWGLSIDKDWIIRGTERLLWIPIDYRRIALDVNASRVAFVCPSGQIQIMKFQ
ncbi:unnamed protein product [Fusarium fujikuroi]|nr:unnamed protein product [Fusarium fujikuroi]